MGMLMSFTLVYALCSGRLGICRTASVAVA
jgi:hypothetical protein